MIGIDIVRVEAQPNLVSWSLLRGKQNRPSGPVWVLSTGRGVESSTGSTSWRQPCPRTLTRDSLGQAFPGLTPPTGEVHGARAVPPLLSPLLQVPRTQGSGPTPRQMLCCQCAHPWTQGVAEDVRLRRGKQWAELVQAGLGRELSGRAGGQAATS